jgi:hypothetical protein
MTVTSPPPPCARCGHAKEAHVGPLGRCYWLPAWATAVCICPRYVRTKPKAKEARRG